jgi:hypothetical protein
MANMPMLQQRMDRIEPRIPHLPQDFPTWAGFREKSSAEDIARIMRQPTGDKV